MSQPLAAEMGDELPRMLTAPPGPRSRELSSRLAAVESPAFDARRHARAVASGELFAPIVYAEARGSNVVDVDGNLYIDLTAGFGAVLLGHRAQAVDDAIRRGMNTVPLALGDVYPSAAKVQLLERLAALYPQPGARAMLGLSGADAVTAALKTALLATGKPGVIAFTGSYHGLSYGPLAALGFKEAFRTPFAAQLSPHVTFAAYPRDAAQLEVSMRQVLAAVGRGDVGAVLVEPIQGRGGVVLPADGFLARLRAACDASGALLIADEIWTGLGRSGEMFASVTDGVVPDLVCIGKGLGGGVPISACIGSKRAMQAWGAHGGETLHTGTHFGSPPACLAALAVLDALTSGSLARRARDVGASWISVLRASVPALGVREVRGRGLMVGLELEGGAGRALAVMQKLLAAGYIVLTGGSDGATITLTPPLTIAEPLLVAFAAALVEALQAPS